MIWTPPERQEAAASKEGTGPIPQIFTIQKLPSASTCTSAQVQYWKTVLGCIPQMLKDLPLILQGKNSALTFRSKQCHYYHYNQPVHCKIESKRGGEITCMQLHPDALAGTKKLSRSHPPSICSLEEGLRETADGKIWQGSWRGGVTSFPPQRNPACNCIFAMLGL